MSGNLQFGSLAAMVQNFESGGNYTATNPTSSASGAYQFTTPTWTTYASQIGVDLNQYPTAASAPPAVQDAVFQHTVGQVGLQPWTCAGCDTPLTNYLATNPGAANLSTFDNGNVVAPVLASNATPDYGTASQGDFYIDPSGSTASPNVGPGYAATSTPGAYPTGAGSAAAGGADVGFFPGIYGGPEETGLSPGAANTISGVGSAIGGAVTGAGTAVGNAISGVGKTLGGFFTGLMAGLENWIGRGFLILIGLVILAIALVALVFDRKTVVQTVQNVAKGAAA